MKNKKRCNILGFTPLDVASQESLKSLRAKISAAGLEILSCWAMGDTLEQIEQSACADVNLVVSSTGLRTAQYMHRNSAFLLWQESLQSARKITISRQCKRLLRPEKISFLSETALIRQLLQM